MPYRKTVILCCLWIFLAASLQAQVGADNWQELKKSAPNVFVDCSDCDGNFIKTEIAYVNYVRDRGEADVHILVTIQATGSGGKEYTIAFIGQSRFARQNCTLKYFSGKTDTTDEVRRGLVKTLKLGLAAYVAQTPLAPMMSVDFKMDNHAPDVKDKWRHWVFNLNTSASLYKEESQNWTYVSSSFSANKVTPGIKMSHAVSAWFEHDEYHYEDVEYSYKTHTYSANSNVVNPRFGSYYY